MSPAAQTLKSQVPNITRERKRELTPSARALLLLLCRLFAKKFAQGNPFPRWHAARTWYAGLLHYSIWTISRAKAELVQAGYLQLVQRHRPDGTWTSTIVRPGPRLWGAIREQARAHRVRKTAHNETASLKTKVKEGKNAPPGDSFTGSELAARVYDRLTLASLRAHAANSTS